MSDKLDGVHPALVEKAQRVLAAMATLGHPMLVTDGVRTLPQQQALYRQGRDLPGHVVTNANGIAKADGGTGVSNHQVKADGFGYAVDCAFLEKGAPSWDGRHPWALYGEAAKAVGLKWGGDFRGRLLDRPHVEMPPEIP